MPKIYAELIRKGFKTIDDVPVSIREEVEKILEGRGRVLIRPSGTEPLLRIMVESEDREEAQTLAERIASTIK